MGGALLPATGFVSAASFFFLLQDTRNKTEKIKTNGIDLIWFGCNRKKVIKDKG
jgi:hypothetical protein